MSIFDFVNSLDDATFEAVINPPLAADGKSFRCPFCGKGAGGDGLHKNIKNGRVKFCCFSGECGGANYSLYDLAAGYLGFGKNNLTAQAAILAVEKAFGETKQTFSLEGKSFKAGWAKTAESARTPRDFGNLYDRWLQENWLRRFLEKRGGTFRGLTYETLVAAHAIYRPNYLVGVDLKAPVIIFPYDKTLYFFREVDGHRRGIPKGCKWQIYFAESIKPKNIIVEGVIDALSVKQVCGKEFGIMALGSASNVSLALKTIGEKICAGDKAKFLVLLDNDKGGVSAAKALVDGLSDLGFSACAKTFAPPGGPKVDANDLLQRGILFGAISDFIAEAGF